MINPELLESAAPFLTKAIVGLLVALGAAFTVSAAKSAQSIALAIARRNSRQADLALAKLKNKLTERASANFAPDAAEVSRSLGAISAQTPANSGGVVAVLSPESANDTQREADAINRAIAAIRQ
ncbi:hypothetical protein [Burkholderia vietnamiensis]|uniref:hypothetical protein n=1 Tax=Burkholderia vietnamiensis TaxID=60552 RepID=UPI0012D9A581|nr:hypothetical protein [Burkholderia vietnamiensis]